MYPPSATAKPTPNHRPLCGSCGRRYGRTKHATEDTCGTCNRFRPRTCLGCGCEFTPSKPRGKYCSRDCFECNGPRPPSPPPNPKRTCEVCGIEFKWRRGPKQPQGSRTCSRECGIWLRYGIGRTCAIPWVTCACGTVFVDRGNHRCERCHQLRKLIALMRRMKSGRCRICDLPVSPWRTNRGHTCRTMHRECAVEERRRAKYLRRSKGEQTGRARRGTLRSLAERDNWVCHICGEQVPKRFGNYGRAPSIDHVYPLTKGGLDVEENRRLAHKACNSAKGDSLDWAEGRVASYVLT